ncbi:probable peroxisomal acyl-coenzyme A oxidase 1 [Phlebotomus argentipes]|uniref:probable peroxisomal acyl-coenzyme A oxidase 1 n=1 Tax=Phlebotomus argentipes TaxID=94469 RepID=UPI002892E2AB|nr:probable peroxisomal acyl-coenzyme A oxidase 1 [Phlebotomus argentipes]
MTTSQSFSIPNKVNPDLENERKKCSFLVEDFAEFWHEGKEKLSEKRWREDFFLNDPEMKSAVPMEYLSHKEKYEEGVRKSTIGFRKIRELRSLGKDGIDNYMALLSGMLGSGITPDGNPFALHYVMFLPTLMGQGTPDQQAEWMGRAWSCHIIGTYAQTELGHGTFIRGLETTSTYDPQTEEFVLNSPTLTSYKWWPGGLAHTANYAVVVAQLYTKGQNHGIFPFIVQLRDEETHMPLPGIKIGEIGAKLGMNSVNNGFLGFDNVRIPRKNMLMKNAQVEKDGTFVKAPSSVLTYGTMMFVRVVIVRDMANYLSKAVTIAVRYSAVRRQSPINPGEREPQIMDHVTQQLKLFPQIAKSIVFRMTADYLWNMYNQVTSELDKGDLDRLPELHGMACCLKAIVTSDAAQAVEICRLACGGHGYMSCSSFPTTYGLTTAACTYEGENTVLLLQTARYLVKSWASAKIGETLAPTVAYLGRNYKDAVKGSRPKWDKSIPGIISAFQTCAAGKVNIAFDNVERRKKEGASHENATNMTSIELAAAADAHGRAFLIQAAYASLQDFLKQVPPALGEVLQDLVTLYAVHASLRHLGDLLRFVNISEADIRELQATLEALLSRVRPNAVGIVDGFDIPDGILQSALGAYDGNVYERMFAEAMKSPLNQEPVNKSFQQHLKPFLKSHL